MAALGAPPALNVAFDQLLEDSRPLDPRLPSSRSGSASNSPSLTHSPKDSRDYQIPPPAFGNSAAPVSSMLRVAIVVLTWIVLSSAVILYNRDIMRGKAHFEYPITLTTLHLAFQTLATRLLHRYTNLIVGTTPADPRAYIPLPNGEEKGSVEAEEDMRRNKAASVAMDWPTWRKQIVPPAVLFSISLVLSNWAYIYLTTAFIHILKAFSPVAILLAAFAFRTRPFRSDLVAIVLMISFGVGLGSYGEAEFNLTGFLIQAVAIAVEATRVTLIQIMLQGGNMGPLKSLYFFAPICLGINALFILPVEGFAALRAIPALGFPTILLNCTLTFLLNLSAVYLIGISSMVLSLSKVVKDVMMVLGSAFLLGDKLSSVQIGGYGVATVGLIWYKSI